MKFKSNANICNVMKTEHNPHMIAASFVCKTPKGKLSSLVIR